jgi:hypothetical protein
MRLPGINGKIILKRMEDVGWIYFFQGSDQWWDLVNTAMNLLFLQKVVNVLTTWASINVPSKTLCLLLNCCRKEKEKWKIKAEMKNKIGLKESVERGVIRGKIEI